MDRREFHKLYSEAPPEFRAELIGGVVYVPSPVSLSHGEFHATLVGLAFNYRLATNGVQVTDNSSVFLGKKDEPQPDISIRIHPDHGGQSNTTKSGYISGAPELIIEVAYSSRSLDLNAKRIRYKKRGVQEYVVLNVKDRRAHWFNFASGKVNKVGSDGILRLRTMPGFWIDSFALIKKNGQQLMATLNQGLATPEHAAFVRKLAAARKS